MQQSSSSRIFLLGAVILGVLATVISFAYLENTSGADRRPGVKVIAAKHDIRENTPLDPERDFKDLEVPASMTELHTRCLSAQYRASYKGQRVNRAILAGTPIMMADLVAAADLELKGDSRALSIPARGPQALSGLLIPGDYVKLMVTRPIVRARSAAAPGAIDPAGPASSGSWESIAVLPKPVKVLAVGPRLTRARQQITVSDQYQMAAEPESQQSVTLEVTEAQAKTILEMTGAGQLPVNLVLCPKEAAADVDKAK